MPLLGWSRSVASQGAALGGEGGTAIFESSACDEVATSDAWYLQCVSDLF